MRKKSIIAVSCIILLTLTLLTTTAYAADLPIDINAIRRRGTIESPIATRFGGHLFTADAQRINEAMAAQIERRLDSASYLFSAVSYGDSIDSHTQVTIAAENAALFAQPTNFGQLNTSQSSDELPLWLIFLVCGICAIGGFVWALLYQSKKKARDAHVY